MWTLGLNDTVLYQEKIRLHVLYTKLHWTKLYTSLNSKLHWTGRHGATVR